MRSDALSVIVPLYNKEREVARALHSVLGQTLQPLEIIVVDDGSTDGSPTEVQRIMDACPDAPVKLLRQPNAGVSAARNRAISEARGEYVALLDADDRWTDSHLSNMARIIGEYPGCGIYAAAFAIDDGVSLTEARTPQTEGVLDFFAESLDRYVAIPSAVVLPRSAVVEAGGFPEGMRMGEDQYLWAKIARRHSVCFTPVRTVIYSKDAANRSTAIYRPEQCAYSFEQLADPSAGDDFNEYIARVAIGKALVQCAKGGTEEADRAIRAFRYTHRNRRALRKLRVLNALPAALRQPVFNLYNFLAWKIFRKGL